MNSSGGRRGAIAVFSSSEVPHNPTLPGARVDMETWIVMEVGWGL
jgi:hypothetical protein